MQRKEILELLPKDPYDDLGFLFWQIMKAWQRDKQHLLGEFDITASQMEVLSSAFHLSLEGSEVTQIAIANFINVDPMTTSTVLKNLEKKGLIKRRASKIDTRARVVEVTKKGDSLLGEAITKVRASTEKMLSKVDQDLLKGQLRILLEILTETNNLGIKV